MDVLRESEQSRVIGVSSHNEEASGPIKYQVHRRINDTAFETMVELQVGSNNAPQGTGWCLSVHDLELMLQHAKQHLPG